MDVFADTCGLFVAAICHLLLGFEIAEVRNQSLIDLGVIMINEGLTVVD